MPVSVHVPIRLRVNAEALAHHPAAIDLALSRALGRALATSRAEVLDRSGGYLAPVLGRPAITWSGTGLSGVPGATRRATERRIRARVAAEAREAGLAAGIGAADPLAGPAAEVFDPTRARSLGRYQVDSYEGGTDVITLHSPGGAGAEDRSLPFVLAWEVAEVTDYDRGYVRSRIRGEALAQGVTLAPVSGLIVRAPSGWTVIVSADGFTGARTISFTFGQQTRLRPRRHGTEVRYTQEALVPPLTSASMTEVALPAGAEARAATFHDLFANQLRTELRDLFDASDLAQTQVLDEADLAALIEQRTGAALKAMTERSGHSTFLVRLDWGDVTFNVGLPFSVAATIGWDGTTPATILPAVTEVQQRATLAPGTGAEGDGRPAALQGGGDQGGAGDGGRYGTDGPGGAGSTFPSLGTGEAFACVPFLDAEPTLDRLGPEGEALGQLVAEIAERLEMAPCDYAASFCIAAAATLRVRAEAVGGVAGGSAGALTQPGGGRAGNLGHAEFRPAASRGILLLRRLAQASVRVARLRRMIRTVYLGGGGGPLLGGEPAHWVLRFEEAVSPPLQEGVGAIFVSACQLIMLQLLESSAQQIAARRRSIATYAPLFQAVLVRRLTDLGGLTALRDRLRVHEVAQAAGAAGGTVRDFGLRAVATEGAPAAVGGAALAAWGAAARGVADAFVAVHAPGYAPGAAQEIVTEQGVAKIRDTSGFLWSRAALERAILEMRGEAEGMDPLLQQLADIPGTIDRFRQSPGAAEAMLTEMLSEMARLNQEKHGQASGDRLFGLQAGRLQESTGRTQVAGLPFALGGIHLLAHEQIGAFFQDDDVYAEGVNHVFAVELGKQGAEHFALFTGLVLLSVICAPVGFVAGVAVAAREVAKVNDRDDLFRSLIDPGLVLSRAEIELERYIAYAGLALSLLPEAGTLARATASGLRGAARGGVVAGARLFAGSVARQVSRQVTEQLARELLPALVQELTVNLLMEQVVVPTLVAPLIAVFERELALRTSVGGPAGAAALIDQIIAAADQRAARPLPGAH